MAKSRNKNNKGGSTGAAPKITGQGDYRTSIADIKQRLDRVLRLAPKGSFGRAGTAAGMAFGGPAGAAVGGAIGRGISAITGYGDYEVKENSLSTLSTSVDTVPQFVRNDHAVRVIHREYVKDLQVPTTPANFTNNTFVINPSNAELFPWLSSMSKQYQQYNIRGMIVEFKSMSSDYAASGPLGTVAIATNYNVSDLPFATKIALENSEFAVSCKPSMSLMHAIECDPEFSGRKYYYVRDAATEGTGVSDPRLYDMGLLQIATNGLPGNAGTTLGEIWVSYDIEFTKPILPSLITTNRRPIIGDGTDGEATTISGNVLTSQVDGTTSFENGAIARIMYTQDQPAYYAGLGGDGDIFPLGNGDAPIVKSLDSAMDGSVVTMDILGGIEAKRDGFYSVTYTMYNDISAGKNHFNVPAQDCYPHSFNVSGTGAVSVATVSGFASHYATAETTRTAVPMLSYTVSYFVSGCGPTGSAGNTVSLVPPKVRMHSGGLVDANYSTCEVTWLQYQNALVLDES